MPNSLDSTASRMYFAGIFSAKDFVQRFFKARSRSGAVNGDVLEAVGNPCIHDTRALELFSHFRRDFAACDPVFDPVFSDSRVGTGKRQIRGGFRMRKVSRIEVESRFLFLCPVDPALEVRRRDFIARDRFPGVQVDGMEIQALCAGDQGKRLVQIGAELPDVSRASRIISRGKNAAGRSACAGFEADDVVALPAVHGNRDLRQSFNAASVLTPSSAYCSFASR